VYVISVWPVTEELSVRGLSSSSYVYVISVASPGDNLVTFEDRSRLYNQKDVDYTYDDLSRLSTAHAEWDGQVLYDQTYTYDATGNILSKSDLGNYSYAGGDPVLANSVYSNPHAATAAGSIAVGYDQRGNMTSRDAKNFTYNYKNELTYFSEGDYEGNYLYDHTSKRIWQNKFHYNVQSRMAPDDPPVDREISQDFNIKDLYSKRLGGFYGSGSDYTGESHIYLDGQNVATIHTSTYPVGNPTTRMVYQHRDHLGSAGIETSNTSPVVEEKWYDYLPFGEIRNSYGHIYAMSASNIERYLFTGQEWNHEMGLYYYDARYYDPELGRFAGPDPYQLSLSGEADLSDPQKLNYYTYVLNNPLKYTDPNGNIAIAAVPVVIGGYEALVGISCFVVGIVGGAAIYDQSSQLSQQIANMEAADSMSNVNYNYSSTVPKYPNTQLVAPEAVPASDSLNAAFIAGTSAAATTATPSTNTNTYQNSTVSTTTTTVASPATHISDMEVNLTFGNDLAKALSNVTFMGRFEPGPKSGRQTEKEKFDGNRNKQKRDNNYRKPPKKKKDRRQKKKDKKKKKANNT